MICYNICVNERNKVMKSPSYIWLNNTDIYFDVLIVKTDYCEAIFTPYGDGAHCVQTAVRYNKDGKYGEWNATSIAKHCDELDGMLKIADEITAVKDGKVAFHEVK